MEQYQLQSGTFMNYRPDTTDLNCIKEIHKQKVYQNVRLGFKFDEEHQSGKSWLDLGGNIGAFSRLIQECGGTGVVFEPIKENYDILLTNVNPDIIQAMNSAVTHHEEEELEFYTATKERDKYRFTTMPNARPVGRFANTNIKELLDMEFDGIKMDIEGAELGIIDAEKLPKCDRLVMEYHFSKDKKMRNFHQRMEILRGMFSTVHYSPSINKYDLDKDWPVSFDQIIYCVR
jgi:FkbM family methyltransferase